MKNQFGTPFSATFTASTTPAIAIQTGTANQTVYVTDISGSSDLAGATITLASTPVGTVLWKDIVGSGNYRINFITPIKFATGQGVQVTVTGSATTNANLSGFVLNNS